MEVRCPEEWCDQSLMALNIRRNWGVSIIAIHRNKEFLVSPGADAVLLVLGTQKAIDKINEK